MSTSPEEWEDAAREEDVFGEEMTDMADLPSAANEEVEESLAAEDHGDHHISELLEEEKEHSTEQPTQDSGIVSRYRQLVHEEHDAISDSGSADALPRRAGSPVDSSLSIPDDTPSVQVCRRLYKIVAKIQV